MINITDIDAINTLPQHGFENNIIKKLGEGRYGTAYLFKHDYVAKITGDWNEYRTAKELKGKINQSLVHIFDCWEALESQYVIIEERLNDNTSDIDNCIKKTFVEIFKKSWMKLDEQSGVRVGNSYWDLMLKCCKDNDKKKIEEAHQIFKQYGCNNHYYNMMFETTCFAINELHIVSPQAKLDFSNFRNTII